MQNTNFDKQAVKFDTWEILMLPLIQNANTNKI